MHYIRVCRFSLTCRHKKTQPQAVGVSALTLLTPSPRKAPAVESQAGFLARGSSLLSAPSRGLPPQWSWQIPFRLQLRGSAGVAPASLLTASGREAPWLSSTNLLLVHPTTIASALQEKFWGLTPQSLAVPRGDRTRLAIYRRVTIPAYSLFGTRIKDHTEDGLTRQELCPDGSRKVLLICGLTHGQIQCAIRGCRRQYRAIAPHPYTTAVATVVNSALFYYFSICYAHVPGGRIRQVS
jgi:hypothetical protein